MSTTRWGEQPSLLLDQVKEALDGCSSLSVRLRVAARAAYVRRSVDPELAALPPTVRRQFNDNP
jgi:hypothetical protein